MVPASWKAGQQESWGRLSALSPVAARLEAMEAPSADRLFLSFSLAGEAFENVPCALERARRDQDGYAVCELRFRRPADRARLRELIARILLTA